MVRVPEEMKNIVLLQHNLSHLKEIKMKKLLLSVYLISIVAFYGYSQNISLSDSNGTIAPNSVLIQAGKPDTNELITYLYIKNTGSSSIDVLCKKYHLSMLDSAEITMCWAGSCYSPETFISPNAQPIPAGHIVSDFVGHYTSTRTSYHFISGESVVRWVFFDRANVNDSASVTIKYTTYPLGIEEANACQGLLSNAYPNPASGYATCGYAVPAGSKGTIIIRDVLGSTVQTQTLSDAKGKFTMNTINLSDGVYFCSLLVDGKISQTKKLIVKH